MLAEISSTFEFIFSIGTVHNGGYDFNPWENVSKNISFILFDYFNKLTAQTMFPVGVWIFIAQGADTVNSAVYGYRYYPLSSTSITQHHQTLNVSDTMYNITSAGTVFWGGDLINPSYGSKLQYTRLYLDYASNNPYQLWNLATMQPGGIQN